MKKDIDEKGYSGKVAQVTRQLIVRLSSVPVVRVDRDDFLRKTFGASPYIDEILAHVPQYVYSTFRPMGGRLTEVFIKLLNGEYTDELELNPEFVKKFEEIEKSESEAIDAQFIECNEAEV